MKFKLASLIVIVLVSVLQADRWYVDNEVSSSGSGDSWEQAFKTIPEAVTAAAEDDDIWVKMGTHYLTTQIYISKQLYLYGGFAGTESDPNDRILPVNQTIIDGQGSVKCMTAYTSTIDGFLFTNGYTNDERGAGLYLSGAATVKNCEFKTNQARTGGAICTYDASANISDCNFIDNSAWLGGAIYTYLKSPTITKCHFANNHTDTFSGHNGGAICINRSCTTIEDCNFISNYVHSDGGAIYSMTDSHNPITPAIINCYFYNNQSSANYGGAIANDDMTNVTIENCDFEYNSAYKAGGAIHNDTYTDSDTKIIGCNFKSNSAIGGGAISNNGASPIIKRCRFTLNSSLQGGAICGFHYSYSPGRAEITNCLFEANTTTWHGGTIYNGDGTETTIKNCTITGSRAPVNDGAIYNDRRSITKITNSILYKNEPNNFYNFSSVPASINAVLDITYTLIGPDEDYYCGLGNFSFDPRFRMDGQWTDPCNSPTNLTDDIWVAGDYHAKSRAGSYHLETQTWINDTSNSPIVDAGNPGCLLGDEIVDANNSRINLGFYGGTAEASKTPVNGWLLSDLTNNSWVTFEDYCYMAKDMGKTEQELPGDLNRDGKVDLWDLKLLAEQWLCTNLVF